MRTKELLPKMDEVLRSAAADEITVEDAREDLLDLLEIRLEITPHTIEWHKEFFRYLHPEVRRCPDSDLESWIVFTQREIAEVQDDNVAIPSRRAMLELLQEERDRRYRLAKHGAPAYEGKDGVKRATAEEVKAYYLGDRFLAIFEAVSGITAEYRRGLKQDEYIYACPLHGDGQDRDPSGHIYADQGRYWCYGCGIGGDVFQLYADFQHIGFAQAIKLLSEGIPEYKYKKENKKWVKKK